MSKLSIVMPVYNVENYLSMCIDSILAQSFFDFELLLIDDGSLDKSGVICDEYAISDKRVKVIHQKNQGVSVARNKGIAMASGTYIGFVDADDWIESQMYEVMIDLAESEDADVVVCGMQRCTDNGRKIEKIFCGKGVFTQKELLLDLYGMPSFTGGYCVNKIFRREKIKDIYFDEKIKIGEDFVFLFNCYKECYKAVKIEDIFYNIRERLGSATHNKSIETIYYLIYGAYLLRKMTINDDIELEAKSIEKFLDTCQRYLPILIQTGKKYKIDYRKYVFKVKWLMLKEMLQAGKLTEKKISHSVIKRYLLWMFKER